jgi:type III restriction enzyme
VNVFGVPLSIVENVDDTGEPPPPPKPTTQVEVLSDRSTFEITWPNVLRVESVVRPALVIDWEKVGALPLDPASKPITAELAPALGGAADMSQVVEIDLEKLPDGFRLQRSIFVASRKAFADLKGTFKGAPDYLVLQLIRIVERFLNSDRLQIPSLFHSDPLRKRILISLNIDLIVQHLLAFIEEQNTESLEPVYDPTARNSG